MKIEHNALPPPDYDVWEEDCCGCHLAETVTIQSGDLTLTIEETKSGIGPDIRIRAAGNGQTGSGVVYAYVDDDGKLNFYMENRTAK